MKVLFISVFLVILITLVSCGNFDITKSIMKNSLVGEWLFTGNANDSSRNSNNGIVLGAILTNDRFGNNNSAYYFNGKSLISTPSFINLGIQSFTISYYLNMSATPNAYNMSFDFAPEACFGIDYNTSGAPGKFSFWVGNNGSSWNVLTEEPINFPTLTFKKWYHIAVVYDQTNYYFYVNGQLSEIFINKEAPRNIMNGFTFGNDTDHHDIGFNGILDDFRIYNYALSSNQVYIQGTNGI